MYDRARPTNIGAEPAVRDVRQMLRRLPSSIAGAIPLLKWFHELQDEDGRGVRVALLDGGVAWMHPVFDGAQLDGRDFTGSGGLIDGTGHGTCNAALLVGQNPHLVRGIAPACELMIAKVLYQSGRGKGDEAVSRAVKWAVGKNVDVIVIPFGRGPSSRQIIRAIRRALEAGCLIFAAAGNRGPDIMAFPANMRGVTAVSAVDSMGHPLAWCCQSQHVDCYAPGEFIWGFGNETLSGSSPATVIAAGVAVLELARRRRLKV